MDWIRKSDAVKALEKSAEEAKEQFKGSEVDMGGVAQGVRLAAERLRTIESRPLPFDLAREREAHEETRKALRAAVLGGRVANEERDASRAEVERLRAQLEPVAKIDSAKAAAVPRASIGLPAPTVEPAAEGRACPVDANELAEACARAGNTAGPVYGLGLMALAEEVRRLGGGGA